MLKVMRKHAKYFYFLFFMIIISFIGWGIGTVDKTGSGDIVAEVGKHKITAEEYWKTYDRISRFYKEIYKDKFNEEMEKKLNLKENVLDSMVNERVLLIAAKEAGIGISDEELQEAITREPAFTRDGVFDKEVYLNRLKLNRITPEFYENSKRQELTLQKIRRLIESSVDASDMGIGSEQTSGDDQFVKMIRESALNDMKEKAVKSYIEGLKKQMKIKINKQLIA